MKITWKIIGASLLGIVLVCLFFKSNIFSASNYRHAIEKVLIADSKTTENAETVSDVIQKMEEIDLSSCPADFNEAYLGHIGAWQKRLFVEREYIILAKRFQSWPAYFEAFVRGFMFDTGQLKERNASLERILQLETEVELEIQVTFTKVKQIAAKYGVNVSKIYAQ